MEKQIAISTNLYKRLEAHAVGFDTPQDVMARILDYYESNSGQTVNKVLLPHIDDKPIRSLQLEINMIPNNELEFKKLMLERKLAWVKIFKLDGTEDIKLWKVQAFTSDSDLKGNLRSGYLRGWKEKGIYKAVLAINEDDLNNIADAQ